MRRSTLLGNARGHGRARPGRPRRSVGVAPPGDDPPGRRQADLLLAAVGRLHPADAQEHGRGPGSRLGRVAAAGAQAGLQQEAQVRCHQPQRLSPGRLVSLGLPGPGGHAGRPPGVLPAHRPRPQLGHHPTQAAPGLSLRARSQRRRLRALRAGRGQALQRQLRRARAEHQAAGRPLLGHLERAQHRRLDDPPVEHAQERPQGGGLAGHLPPHGRRRLEGPGQDRAPSRHDHDRRDRRLRRRPQGLWRQHGSTDLRARVLLPERRLQAADGHGRDPGRLPEVRQPRRVRPRPPGSLRCRRLGAPSL